MTPERFDYIIIGGGSAGSVLAYRLTADPKIRVLLLEAGGSERHPYIAAPGGFIRTIDNPQFNWCFHTEPQDGVNGRAILFPRGKVLGGSSAINGHLYVRGQPRDYDIWAQLGNRGWSYDDVLPYFKRSESRLGGDPGHRGTDGPLHVSDPYERHPLCEAFIEAAEEQGLPRNPDYNGPQQEGVAYYQRTIRNGRRWSAAHAFLRPAMRRANLTVVTGAVVTGLTVDGKTVTGVSYRHHGQPRLAEARDEVILSAGAVGSPHILQLSGIGPGALLQSLGIAVRHDLPGVGEGFQDHFALRVAQRVRNIETLNERARGLRLGFEIGRWLLTGRGVPSMSPAHVAAFARSAPELDTPDLQFVFSPASYSEGVIGKLQPFPGMTAGFWQMRPESRGYIRARSSDPFEAPVIQPNYLTADTDCRLVIAGFNWCRRLFASPSLAPYCEEETLPGKDVNSEDEILDYARSRGSTVYHAVSSCRMGQDPMAVVDDRLRLRGMERLRIADASVMPSMPSANTNAATLMIAEKAADLILQDRRDRMTAVKPITVEG